MKYGHRLDCCTDRYVVLIRIITLGWMDNFRRVAEFRESAEMPKRRFTDEQTAFALRQAEAGSSVDKICRKLGFAEATF